MDIDGVRWFLSRGKNYSSEARSILYAVRYAEHSYPLVRLLILSDSLALVLALL